MSNTTLADAENLFQQAVTIESRFDWFTVFKQPNQEEASELFSRAGAKFKAARAFARAGEAYQRAAKAAFAAQASLDALQAFREAGKCYSRVQDIDNAKRCFDNSIELYLNEDKFQSAAKLHVMIATMLEEDGQIVEAIAQHEKAIELYETEHVTSAASKQRLAVAHLCASVDQFDRAIALFESSVQLDGAQRFAAKTYLFKAFLCHVGRALANDESDVNDLSELVARYKRRVDSFGRSREGEFCDQVVICFTDWDDVRYERAVSELSRGCGLGQWEMGLIEMGAQLIRRNQYREPSLQGIDDNPCSPVEARVVDACPFDPPVMMGSEPDL